MRSQSSAEERSCRYSRSLKAAEDGGDFVSNQIDSSGDVELFDQAIAFDLCNLELALKVSDLFVELLDLGVRRGRTIDAYNDVCSKLRELEQGFIATEGIEIESTAVCFDQH